MRTTLTLDADVSQMIEEEVHRLHKPFKQVVNDAIRRGLSTGPSRRTAARYRVRPHEATLQPGVDVMHLNALVDDIEVEVAPLRSRARRRKVS